MMPAQWAYAMAFVAFVGAVFTRAWRALQQAIAQHKRTVVQPFDDAEAHIQALTQAIAQAENTERTLLAQVAHIHSAMHEEILTLHEETQRHCHEIFHYYRTLEQQQCRILLQTRQQRTQRALVQDVAKHIARHQSQEPCALQSIDLLRQRLQSIAKGK